MADKTIVVRATGVVQSVEERKRSRYVSGFGESAKFEQISEGWFVALSGDAGVWMVRSGSTRPDVVVGQTLVVEIYCRDEDSK